MYRAVSVVVFSLLAATSALGQTRANLQSGTIGTNGWFEMNIGPVSSQVYSVEASSTLSNWAALATLIGTELYTNKVLPFVDPSSSREAARFYRVRTSAISSANDWKNQVYYPQDPFLSPRTRWDVPDIQWIKFAIVTNEPHRVYFQNSEKYVFHYDFARARLPQFAAMTRAEFDEVSLRTNAQKVVLGTVLYAPEADMREAAIQFVGLDPFPREQVAEWFEVVKVAIAPNDRVKVLYIPTFEQAGVAQTNRTFFESKGIEVSTVANWTPGDDCYAPGWAIGELKYFTAAEVNAAYADGRLLPTDILMIDAVPAELPYVAGIFTLTPATPNSHVAILAKSLGVPFAYSADEEFRAKAQSLRGKQVVFDTMGRFGGCGLGLLDLSGTAVDFREELAQLKAPAPIVLTPKARLGSYTTNVESLYPADIKYAGGKAANLGFIRRTLPTNSPPAIAITFDLWDDFLEQRMTSGNALRQEINDRLGQFASYPPHFGNVSSNLALIRDMIEDDTVFTQAQMDTIAGVLLGRFDPNKKIRFRSSTNVEDSESFTGAGLYDSYSGCLADDQDSDTIGPSICDPDETRERGVFRAIRKVYASFYNDNAFLERLRHGVDESQVGMAILVHYSNPDEEEMANGVATVKFQNQGGTTNSYTATMVTQKGAVSITNPDGTAIPEVVRIQKFFGGIYPDLVQWSSLVPLGDHVLQWEDEYKKFAEMFSRVAGAFQQYYPAKEDYTLDFEYKKIVPGHLHVKQVREIPTPDPDQEFPTYLLNSPERWCVFQGEYGDVFANHRLKSYFDFSTRNLKLTPENLSETIFGPTTFEYLDGTEIKQLTGGPGAWPNAEHSLEPLTDSWTAGSALPRKLTLETTLQRTVRAGESPVLTLLDGFLVFKAEYLQPQLGMNSMNELDNTITNESVMLVVCPQTNSGSILINRLVQTNGVTADIEFYWPEHPKGATVGYTAPLVQWKETVLAGVASQPLVLKGYYSQTYRPQHHNFSEEFLFEPRLEPGISPELIMELENKNIRLIYVHWEAYPQDGQPSTISYIGADGSVRPAGK